ncbi:MAG: archaemetzincin family Zn-dependent metalloprotease [bacterium]
MICLYQQKGLEFFNLISKILKKTYNLATIKASKFQVPKDSFNPLRNQYNASEMIEQLKDYFDERCDKHLFIVDTDLYTPRFNFIFGLAELQTCAAIVSLYRLVGGGLINERLAKEVIHEVGHLMGLTHCSIPTCVMHFSNSIEDTDKKNTTLCDKCRRQLERI